MDQAAEAHTHIDLERGTDREALAVAGVSLPAILLVCFNSPCEAAFLHSDFSYTADTFSSGEDRPFAKALGLQMQPAPALTIMTYQSTVFQLLSSVRKGCTCVCHRLIKQPVIVELWAGSLPLLAE